MSTLSHKTTELLLSPFNSAKCFRGAKGQAVQQFFGVKLTIPIDMTLEDVVLAIDSLLLVVGCPTDSIKFEGVESEPRNATIKLVYVGFADGGVAMACLPNLHIVLTTAFPIQAAQPPTQAVAEEDIYITPTPDNAMPLNCRVCPCLYWCYGQQCFLPNEMGSQQAATHSARPRTLLPPDEQRRVGALAIWPCTTS